MKGPTINSREILGKDWKSNLELFNDLNSDALKNIREDARYVRLLHKGSSLRESLNVSWREYGCYHNAKKKFQDAIQQENLSSTVKKHSGVYIMTIHKSKGKQFNEVFLFEGFYKGRFVRQPNDEKNINQSRLALRVGVTRAMSRATILSPSRKQCEIL